MGGPTAYMPDDALTIKRNKHYSFSGHQEDKIIPEGSTPRHVGPGSYTMTSGIGRQINSARKTSSNYTFGKYPRVVASAPDGDFFNEDRKTELGSMGKQVLSTGRTSASYGFGSATRDQQDRAFLVKSKGDSGTM